MRNVRLLHVVLPASLALAGAFGCGSSNDSPATGAGGSGGNGGSTQTGTGGSTGAAGATGTAGAGGGAAGAGGGGATGAAGAGGSGIGTLEGTATRPQLSSTAAANFTILQYLAQAGNLTAGLTRDDWDPTAGVGDVATFTPTFTVAASGGTHTSVQAAINAATGAARVYIQVMPGTYRESVCVRSTTPITLYSANPDASQTVIVGDGYSGKLVANPPVGTAWNTCASSTAPAVGATYGTSGSSTFAINAANFQIKNITISNDTDETGLTTGTQAVALMTQGDKLVFENVRLLGNQDTLYMKTSNIDTVARSYFKGCYVEGDVDYVFGRATSVLDGCEIKYVTNRRGPTNGGDVVAPSTDTRNAYGILIVNGNFTADADAAAGSVGLGRAWDEGFTATTYPPANVAGFPNGQVVIRDSTLGAHISGTAPWESSASAARPFSITGTATVPANRLYEFNNTGPGSATP